MAPALSTHTLQSWITQFARPTPITGYQGLGKPFLFLILWAVVAVLCGVGLWRGLKNCVGVPC